MEEVTAKGKFLASVSIGDVIEGLKIAIQPRVKTSRRSHGGEQAAQVKLRVSHIAGSGGGSLQSVFLRKGIAGVGIFLAARHSQPTETKLVDQVGREGVRLAC